KSHHTLLEIAMNDDHYLKTQLVLNPNFEVYIDMIGRKTAALFKAASQIGAYSARANFRIVRSLGEFGWKAGLAFQVMDDVLDICGQETGKQIGKDISEDKLGNAATLMALKQLTRGKK